MPEIIAGRNPVLEALKAGRPVNKILVDKNIVRHSAVAEVFNLARNRNIPVEYVERQIIDRTSAGSQGILAFTAAKEYVTLSDIFEISIKKNEPPFYIILDGVEDPQNLGAILRTADATGVHGVIIRERRAVGLTSAVARASAGAIEYVPVSRVTNIAQTIEQLKGLKLKTQNALITAGGGVWVVGIDMSGDADFDRVDYKAGTAIVIGGEGQGLSPLVRKRCDTIARIPMKGKISSLNASVAAALAMYEVFRQRMGNSLMSPRLP